MRIVIEIDGTPEQPQVTVTSPSATQQTTGTTQPLAGGATSAGQAPTAGGQTGEATVTADVTAPIVARPGDTSAGAAPNLSAT